MRRLLILSAAGLGLVLTQAAVHAQPLNSVGQTPPAPNSNQGAPQPLNSLPRGGATGATVAPGASLGGAVPATPGYAAAPPPVNTLHPMHPPRRVVRRPFFHRRPAHPAPATSSDASPVLRGDPARVTQG